MFARQFADSPEECFNLLKGDAHPPEALPAERVPNGLSAARQWYLHNQIRPFCTDETKDTTCPRPTVPVPPRNAPPPPRNPPQVQRTPATPEERAAPATAGRRRLYNTSPTVDDEPPAQMPRINDGSRVGRGRARGGRARGGRGGNRGRGRGHIRDDGHI